eukprot:TRINITY_DN9076_c0_g1_i7.p1 TRINITY_DN9076_c0_g1~~TRINITY_DN9076_c0_g1_i7.p1  ORF type:complete len:1375 (-),score=150.38 TRINITY_DN9076_c0_g1_i7:56-4180(-)
MLISLSFFATRINELCLEESFAREVIAADSTVELEKEVRTLLIAEHCAQICSLMNHVYCVTQFIVATIQLESWHMEFVQWEKQNGTVLHNSTKQRKGRKKMSIAELAKQPIQPEPEIPRPVITAYCCHCKLAQEFAETSHEKGPPTFVPPLPQSRPLLPQLENSQQEIEEDRSGGDADEEDLEEDETAVARREFSHWFKDQRGENDDLSSATGSAAFETLRGGRMVPISEPCLSAFAISPSSRWQQYEQFRQCFRDPAENGLHTAEQEYQVSVRDFEEADMQSRHVLENARVIALTATGCSNNQQLIKKLKPAVLLIEEAAEILEMQLLTCLTEGVEHIVLIGDHKQLQPQVEIFEYERKNHLNISMFERLVSNGSRPFPQTVLTIQRRMRPEISQLVRPIYTVPIIDRPTTTSVQSRHGVFYKENPPGFAKPIFWWLHSHSDEASGVGVSTMNTREIAMTKCILKVLVTQENVPMEDITVLSPYLGQVRELRKALRNEFGEVQVHTVDRFQGDENTIVILSMTRSRETAFVKKENRMCVALSRARRSLFVLSHSGLPEMAPHWKRAYETFEASGCVGSELPLQCPRHPESCSLLVAPDPEAKRPCNKFCGAVYACGHSCRKRCHPDPSWHMHTECTLPCVRPCINCGQRVCKMKCNERCVCAAKLTVELDCGHIAKFTCHKGKPECKERVKHELPCGHEANLPCGVDPRHERCKKPTMRPLPCGRHERMAQCGEDMSRKKCKQPVEVLASCQEHTRTLPCDEERALGARPPCLVVVTRTLLCGHGVDLQCHVDFKSVRCNFQLQKELPCGHTSLCECSANPAAFPCKELVTVERPDCQHKATILCSQRDCLLAIPCPKRIEFTPPCGHGPVTVPCHERNQPCTVLLPCTLICGHETKFRCGTREAEASAYICKHPRQADLPCGHAGFINCNEDPGSVECTQPCSRLLECHHPCQLLCSQPCTLRPCSFCEEEEELRVKRGLGTKPVIERLTVLEMDDLARRVNASEEGYSWTVTQALRITNYRQYQRFIEARKKLEEPVSRTVFVICSVTDIKNIVVNGFSTQLGPYGSVVSAFTSLSQLPVVGASEAILLCDGAIGKCGPAPSPPVALHKRQMAECEFDTLLDATTHSFVFHFSERILPRFVMKVRRKHAPDYWLDWRLTGFALHPVSDAAIIDKWRAALMETQCCAKVPVTSVSVTRIENSSLWKTFCRKKDEIVERYSFAGVRDSTFPYEMHPLLSDCLDARVSEYYLFHGTTEECALQIAQTGFTEKLAKLEGLYGAGSYFAMNACKSMQYSSKPTRTFIVARVALGHPHIPTLRYKERILPWRDESAGLRYDSLLAVPGKSNNGQQRHHEFVIFDGAQTYPEFIIKFS